MKVQALPILCCGTLLQTRERLGGAGFAPIDGIGIGDVDRGRHRHAGALFRQLLHQLDVFEIERHAGMDVGIADLDHARRAEGAAELHQPFHRTPFRRAVAPSQHRLFGPGQFHG